MDPDGRDLGEDKGYAISGKIMLSAIVILFFVVILMFSLHIYARWFLLRARRRQTRVRRRSAAARAHIVFYVDPGNNATTTAARGLDARVLNSLPVFTYSSKTDPDSKLECAVCLSEFEENESGRVLPKCNHSFHLECIDMWFHSHSTCPLCRAPVEEYGPSPANPGDLILNVSAPEAESDRNSGTDLCATCQNQDGHEPEGTSSIGSRRKLSVEVPRRNSVNGFDGESSLCDSATSQSQSFRSPMSRILSFKRILSRDRRQSPCSSPRTTAAAESDLERGGTQTQS